MIPRYTGVVVVGSYSRDKASVVREQCVVPVYSHLSWTPCWAPSKIEPPFELSRLTVLYYIDSPWRLVSESPLAWKPKCYSISWQQATYGRPLDRVFFARARVWIRVFFSQSALATPSTFSTTLFSDGSLRYRYMRIGDVAEWLIGVSGNTFVSPTIRWDLEDKLIFWVELNSHIS